MIRKATLGTRREQLVNDCLLSLAQFLGRVASDDEMPHDCVRSEGAEKGCHESVKHNM